MSSNKKAGIKSVQKKGELALVKFPASKIRQAFTLMAETANAADSSNESRQAAALDVCMLAHEFRLSNSKADIGTVADGWREHLKGITMELAVAGNRFAELKPGDGDKAATAKLTGYGNNVASIAKGCIEFDIDPADTAGDGEGDASYRSVRKQVEAKRAEARRDADPDAAKFADAVESLDDTFAELRKLIVGTGDVLNVNEVQGALSDMLADVTAQLLEQSDTEAEAKAA